MDSFMGKARGMIITDQTIVSVRCTVDAVVQPALIIVSRSVEAAHTEAIAFFAEGNEGKVIQIIQTHVIYEPPRDDSE